MGDMADFVLDQLFDPDFDNDYELDGFHNVMYNNETGEMEGPYSSTKFKTCRACGITQLVWSRHKKKWRLFTTGGKLHQCKVNPLKE